MATNDSSEHQEGTHMKGTTRSMTWLAMVVMATLVLACQQAVTPVKEEPQPPPSRR